MAIYDYPYTNFHDLNLDQIIERVETLADLNPAEIQQKLTQQDATIAANNTAQLAVIASNKTAQDTAIAAANTAQLAVIAENNSSQNGVIEAFKTSQTGRQTAFETAVNGTTSSLTARVETAETTIESTSATVNARINAQDTAIQQIQAGVITTYNRDWFAGAPGVSRVSGSSSITFTGSEMLISLTRENDESDITLPFTVTFEDAEENTINVAFPVLIPVLSGVYSTSRIRLERINSTDSYNGGFFITMYEPVLWTEDTQAQRQPKLLTESATYMYTIPSQYGSLFGYEPKKVSILHSGTSLSMSGIYKL